MSTLGFWIFKPNVCDYILFHSIKLTNKIDQWPYSVQMWHHMRMNWWEMKILGHPVDITPLNSCPIENHTKWPLRRSFFFYKNNSVIVIFHWLVILMVRMGMLTVEIFHDCNLKEYTPISYVHVPRDSQQYCQFRYRLITHGQFLF